VKQGNTFLHAQTGAALKIPGLAAANDSNAQARKPHVE
jgi:hypothetical protein